MLQVQRRVETMPAPLYMHQAIIQRNMGSQKKRSILSRAKSLRSRTTALLLGGEAILMELLAFSVPDGKSSVYAGGGAEEK